MNDGGKTMKTKHVSRRLRRFARATKAVSALEYAILVGVIAVGIVAALATFNTEIQTALGNIGDNLDTTTSTVGVAAPPATP